MQRYAIQCNIRQYNTELFLNGVPYYTTLLPNKLNHFLSGLLQVPSHLFEHFARTPSVISQWAKHHVTGTDTIFCIFFNLLSYSKDYS